MRAGFATRRGVVDPGWVEPLPKTLDLRRRFDFLPFADYLQVMLMLSWNEVTTPLASTVK